MKDFGRRAMIEERRLLKKITRRTNKSYCDGKKR
jgi:hypothetical protein